MDKLSQRKLVRSWKCRIGTSVPCMEKIGRELDSCHSWWWLLRNWSHPSESSVNLPAFDYKWAARACLFLQQSALLTLSFKLHPNTQSPRSPESIKSQHNTNFKIQTITQNHYLPHSLFPSNPLAIHAHHVYQALRKALLQLPRPRAILNLLRPLHSRRTTHVLRGLRLWHLWLHAQASRLAGVMLRSDAESRRMCWL